MADIGRPTMTAQDPLSTARPGHPLSLGPRALSAWVAALLAAGCALPLQSARMALPPALESAAPLPFEGLGGGRQGRFTFEGEAVAYKRMGDALSVFDRLKLDRVAVEFERGAAMQGRCDGRATGIVVGIVDAAVRPLTLTCRFGGALPGELRLAESRLAAGGTRQAREGRASFGTVVIDIRSEHALAGSPLPLSQPAGYRLTIGGRDVAALELTAGTPVLRRAAQLDETSRVAVAQTALALGLLFDPAATLR
jgi:hypothetical protein